MRLIAPRNAGPAAVNKYLLPHEHQVITVRKHPAVLIGPISILLAGVLIALVLGTTLLKHSHQGILILILVVVCLFLYLGFKTWEWSEDYFVVTSDRMLQASGVFTRKIAMMPLVKVTDMSFQRSSRSAACWASGSSSWNRPARTRPCATSTTCPTPSSCTWRSVP